VLPPWRLEKKFLSPPEPGMRENGGLDSQPAGRGEICFLIVPEMGDLPGGYLFLGENVLEQGTGALGLANLSRGVEAVSRHQEPMRSEQSPDERAGEIRI